jgi:tetratricopeptide (TPR) repeat protein
MGRSKPQHVDDPVAFGARVREARTARGLSLREAAFPGCSPSFLSRVEAGQRVPSQTLIAGIAARLDVEPEALLGRRLDGRLSETELAAAELSARMGDSAAEGELHRLRDTARTLGDRRSESRALEALGLIEIERRHDDRAIELLEEALHADGRTGPRERPALHRALGRAYAGVGDLPRAIATLRGAFDEAAADPPDAALMTQFGTSLANAYTDSGRFAEAEDVLARVLRHEGELAAGNAVRLEWALARTYLEEGKLPVAENYVRRVLARLETTEERHLVGQAHLLLGRVLLDRGRVDDAVAHLDRSEELLADAPPVEIANLSLDRARVAAARGDADEAEARARQALDRTEATEPSHAGRAYGLLAEVELTRGNLSEARFLCQKAIELMTGTTAPAHIAAVYETLSRVEERAGNLPAALAALRARPGAESAAAPSQPML